MSTGPGEIVAGVPSPARRRVAPRGTAFDSWWAGLMTDPLFARFWRWGAPVFVVLVAAILRLQSLGYPDQIDFDETYYVKDAWTLAHLGYEGSWPPTADASFAKGDPNTYSSAPSFIAHPPLGKWMIALGELATGGGNPVGWRISTAIVGILLVVVTMAIAHVLFRRTLVTVLAGGFLAIDGTAIVMSRVALLDNSVALFASLGALAVLLDRNASRARLESWTIGRETAHRPTDWGPLILRRPWLLAAGLAFGAASSVKWNGFYFLAVFGVYVVLSDVLARRRMGIAFWGASGVLKQGWWNLLLMVPIALATYVASWTGWFVTKGGYFRTWVEDGNPRWTGALHWVPLWFQNWWHYQTEMYGFNVNEHSPHAYEANPLTWLLMVRPTSMYYQEFGDGTGGEITVIANPLIWYSAVAALIVVLVIFLRKRDRQLGFILVGIAAGYLPWLMYTDRTVFQFYVIAFEPFLMLALAWTVAHLLGTASDPTSRRSTALLVGASFLVLCVAFSVFWYPMWTGARIPLWFLRAHFWFPSWI